MLKRDIAAPTNDNSYSSEALQLPGTLPRSRRSARRAIAMFSIWRRSDRPHHVHDFIADNQFAPFGLP
jgi:hypothetical protein